MTEERKVSRKSLETTREVSKVVKKFYEERKGKLQKVGWGMAGMPVELFHAFDIDMYYPENHAAYLASKKGMPLQYVEAAESYGFPTELCSYARTNTGWLVKGLDMLPKPDFMISDNICDTHHKWTEFVAAYLKVPVFHFDCHYLPYFCGVNRITRLEPRDVEYYRSQLEDLVVFLEEITRRKLDWDRLVQSMELSRRTAELWGEVHELRKAVPCPMGTEDSVACLLPSFIYSGTEYAVEFYTKLRDEVAQRVRNKVGVIPEEKYRLLWVDVAIWHDLPLFNYVQDFGAVFALDLYPQGFGARIKDLIDPQDPIGSLARKYIAMFFENSILETKTVSILEFTREYKIDGVVFHCNQGCRLMHTGGRLTRNLLREKLDIPSLIIETDMADSRFYNEVEVKRQLQEFIQLLAEKKRTS
jgi:benzoyl-CoA reductase/2-hydroxyglutaryl-CoA dehydratase subunit BcrC/BadD/HgdB